MNKSFETTGWSIVAKVARNPDSPEGRAALEKVFRIYREPLHSYVKKRGYSPDQADDIVQSFFLEVIEKKTITKASPERGKFRTFLLTSLRNHLANIEERSSAQKRGGDFTRVPMAVIDDDESPEVNAGTDAEHAYDRRWALALLSRAMDRLDSEMTTPRKRDRYVLLKPYLISDESTVHYAELARQTSLGEGMIKSAVHRLRRRFGQILREEISLTIRTPEEIDEEIRDLLMILK